MRSMRGTATVVLLLALALAGGGCGDDDAASGGDPAPAGDPVAVADRCAGVDLATPPAEPVEIRFGHGVAAEEQAWLQFADPELAGATHYGSWYTVSATALNAPERLAAYQAGDLDAGTIGTTELVQARAQGLDLAAVASIVKEAEGAFNTTYAALDDSGIRGPADLKGRKVGIVAPNSNTEYWAKSAAQRAGLDPERDVEYVSVPFPDQEQAVRAGQIDVAVLVQPFYATAERDGGLTDVFDSLTGPGIDQELLDVWFDRGFVADHPEVYCAWREDYLAATAAYLGDRRAAAAALIRAELLGAESVDDYLAVEDWARSEDAKLDLGDLDALIDNMVQTEFVARDATVPAAELVLPGYSLVR